MPKSEGKKFEEDFRNSVPEDRLCLRLQDAGGWSNAENTRFTISNICDFILFDGKTVYLVELKSVKDHRLPVKNINYRHLEKLVKLGEKKNVKSVFFINYRNSKIIDGNIVYLVACDSIKKMIDECFKSIADKDCNQGGILSGKKKTTRWRYDLHTKLRNDA